MQSIEFVSRPETQHKYWSTRRSDAAAAAYFCILDKEVLEDEKEEISLLLRQHGEPHTNAVGTITV